MSPDLTVRGAATEADATCSPFGARLNFRPQGKSEKIAVSLLTGGGDKPYAFGLATALAAKGISLDMIAGSELDCPEFHGRPGVEFHNLRGDQASKASVIRKAGRVLLYYIKLIAYAAHAKPTLFHILWNNKFELLDRSVLTLYYRLLGKRIILTAHNVNAGRRDSSDSLVNRLTLRMQYRLAQCIFVHTEKMKVELIEEFGIPDSRVRIIPFGINNAVPRTTLTPAEARQRLGLANADKTILFFGNIAPYKGLEFLIKAFQQASRADQSYRLIIAGRPKHGEVYWQMIQQEISASACKERILLRPEFIPDAETEVYFKAADVLALPYRHIYQSGVLFLAYSFGLPVIAADVGSLRDEIVEGDTGFVFRPEDPADLAETIARYFSSDLYGRLDSLRPMISEGARQRHSWEMVGDLTIEAYRQALCEARSGVKLGRRASDLPLA